MLPLEMLGPFLAGLVVLQLSPGPDMLLVLNRGMVQGTKAAFSTVIGIVFLAGTVQVGLLALGFGVIVRHHPEAMLALHLTGAGYLLYLGVRMMTTDLSMPRHAAFRPSTVATALREGALGSLTNPKTLLFLFVVLPQFIEPQGGPVWMQMAVLGVLHKLAGLLTLSFVALAAERIGRWTRRWPRFLSIQRNFCGVLMIAIGITLVLRMQLSA